MRLAERVSRYLVAASELVYLFGKVCWSECTKVQCFCVDPGEDTGRLKRTPVSKFSTPRTLPSCVCRAHLKKVLKAFVCVRVLVCMCAILTAERKKKVLAQTGLLKACFSLVVTEFLSVTDLPMRKSWYVDVATSNLHMMLRGKTPSKRMQEQKLAGPDL